MLLETFASEIVELVSAILPNRTVNIMNTDGIIIASTEKERIGTFHKGAQLAAARGDMISITDETVAMYPGAKKGCNAPLVVNGSIIGVIGIFGNPEEIKTLSSFVELYVGKYYQLEAMTIPILRESEMKQRLLKEIIMPTGEDGSKHLLEELGLVLHYPMECLIISPLDSDNISLWEKMIGSSLSDLGVLEDNSISGFIVKLL